MTDKPIIFSGPMVRALLDGRKTQTRRVLKPQPPVGDHLLGIYAPGLTAVFNPFTMQSGSLYADKDTAIRLPYAPGDRLWVREQWSGEHFLRDTPPSERLFVGHPARLAPLIPATWYWADGDPTDGDWEKPRPSIHMPRWASRLTLVVTDVRVQRVQEIIRGEAMEEGCPFPNMAAGPNPCDWFRDLWDKLNAPRGHGWEANPWVVAVTFTVHRQNIDQMKEVA